MLSLKKFLRIPDYDFERKGCLKLPTLFIDVVID